MQKNKKNRITDAKTSRLSWLMAGVKPFLAVFSYARVYIRESASQGSLLRGLSWLTAGMVIFASSAPSAHARLYFTNDLFKNEAETFRIGDLDDTDSNNLTLEFGSVNTETLSWENTADAFNFSDSVTIGGSSETIANAGFTLDDNDLFVAGQLGAEGGIFTDGDFFVGNIGLDDVGTDNVTSGASLIGVFDEFANSDATTVQAILNDFDDDISASEFTNFDELYDNGIDDTDTTMDIDNAGFPVIFNVDSDGTGAAFQIADQGTTIADFTTAGAITLAPTSGSNFSVTTAGAGDISLTSADTIAIDSGDWDISATGDITGAGAITADGTLTLSAAAGQLAFSGGTSASILTTNGAVNALTIGGTGGTNNENLTFDYDTTANTIGIGTTTGVTNWNFGSINLVTSGDYFIGSTGLKETNGSGDNGATLIGVDQTEFANSASTNVQDVLDDFDAQITASLALDFEDVYGNDGDNTLTTTNANFTVNTGVGDFIVTSNDWSIDASGAATFAGTLTSNGTFDANGVVTIGDGGDTVAIDSSDWDISATGDITGAGAITADGTLTLSAAAGLLNFSGATSASITSASALTLGGSGAGNNENLTFDFDTTANTVEIGTGTGVTSWDFNSIGVTSAATIQGEQLTSTDDADINDNLTAGDIIIDEAAGVLAFSGGTSASILTTNGAVNALTIGGTGGTNNENLTFDFDTTANTIGVGTGTGVTLWDFGTINLATDALDLSEGNITNVGDIALDSLTADNGTTINVSDTLNMAASTSITWNGTAILADAAGTMTLSNIDAADATTENTVEALIFDADAENITGVWEVQDNVALQFGNDADVLVQYDEAGENRWEITGTGATVYIEDNLLVGGASSTVSGLTMNGDDAFVADDLGVEGAIYSDTYSSKYIYLDLGSAVRTSAILGTVASGNAITIRFDETNASNAAWSFPVPDDADTTQNMTMTIFWSPEDGNGADDAVELTVDYGSFGAGDIVGSFSSITPATPSPSGTALQIVATDVTLTDAAAGFDLGEIVHIDLGRDASSGSDTYGDDNGGADPGDINIHAIRITYQGKKIQ